jgi:hypothetical protein
VYLNWRKVVDSCPSISYNSFYLFAIGVAIGVGVIGSLLMFINSNSKFKIREQGKTYICGFS